MNNELLKALHLLTRTGELNADARRKLKQVNHLAQLLKNPIDDLTTRHEKPVIADVGAGKAYLGFILYESFFKDQSVQMISIEERAELVEKGKTLAASMQFNGMEFISSKIEEAVLPERVHMLTALHACDTATDDAIALGLKHKVDYLVVIPCCQAEVARQLTEVKTPVMSELWSHNLHKREFGSHITNVIRALVLESLGYQVSVTELVGWEHSLKNELILAKRVHAENKKAKEKLKAILKEIPIQPKITRVLSL